MHCPQQPDLVAGAMEPVVAQVQQQRWAQPGQRTIPGKVK